MPDNTIKEAHDRNIKKIQASRDKTVIPALEMVHHKVNGKDQYYYILTPKDLPMRYNPKGTIQYKWVDGQEVAINTDDNTTHRSASLGHRFEAIYGSGVSRDDWIAQANGESGRRF